MKYLCLFALLFAVAAAQNTSNNSTELHCFDEKVSDLADLYSKKMRECFLENPHFNQLNKAIKDFFTMFNTLMSDLENCNSFDCYAKVLAKYGPNYGSKFGAILSEVYRHLGHLLGHMDPGTVKCVINVNSQILNKYFEIPGCFASG